MVVTSPQVSIKTKPLTASTRFGIDVEELPSPSLDGFIQEDDAMVEHTHDSLCSTTLLGLGTTPYRVST